MDEHLRDNLEGEPKRLRDDIEKFSHDPLTHSELANDPAAFLGIAETLKRSAYKLSEPSRRPNDKSVDDADFRVVFMLEGFSFENLMKGLWVANGKIRTGVNYGDESEDDWKVKTHRLAAMATSITEDDSIDFVFSSDEVIILKDLESYILWIGRYPVPLKAKDAAMAEKNDRVEQLKDQLWDRLRDHLLHLMHTKVKIPLESSWK